MKILTYFSLSLCFNCLFTTNSSSFEDNEVHPAINIASSQPDQSRLDEVLKEIGFQNGIDEIFRDTSGIDKKVYNWIKQGGTNEDDGLRSFNHFYDPTKQSWEDAGLFGVMNSSLVWAQDNDASWDVAREYFYQALITGNDEKYTSLFVTLGQLMHLISDKAVPAHVRDDAHPEAILAKILEITHFEVWTKKNVGSLNYNGIGPGQEIFAQAVSNEYTPLSALWDIDKYDTTNPSITLEPLIGLAEYTNANFFSEDTPFSKEYPYPNYPDQDTSVEKQTKLIPDPFQQGREVARKYWMKKATVNASSYRLMGIGWHTFWTEALHLDGFEDSETLPPMDKYVFEDYADRLIPRAVGYSATLLDYFFRGTLEISPPDQYVYAIIDGGEIDLIDNTQYLRTLKAKVRNNTPDEEMLAGSLVAIAKYKNIIGYQPDLSSGSPSAGMRETEFSYSVSAPIEISSLSSTTPEEFSFDFTDSPIPAGITDLYLNVVFRGTLGKESEQAIAVGIKDLNEPQHIATWNDTDYFQLNGIPVKAEDIRRDQPLIEQFAHIDPHSFTETIGFSRHLPDVDSPPIVVISDLPPARYSRLIVVTDADDTSYFLTDQVTAFWPPDAPGLDDPSFDGTWKYSLPTAVHQEDSDGVWESSPVYRVRDIIQHQSLYFMNSYPEFLYINNLPAPSENALGPFPATIDLSN